MRVLFLIFAAVSLAIAQTSISVAQLKQFIHSSVEKKFADKQVVRYLKMYKLTERLTDRDLMMMIAEGPGPETTEQLKEMQEATKSLPVPDDMVKPAGPPPAPMPPPSVADQDRILSEAREIALEYTTHLPDFLCLQYTRRYIDPQGTDYFQQVDSVATRLSYFDQKEDYKVISVGGKLTNKDYQKLGGAISSGEFGTMLKQIFEPETAAEFAFERWAKLDGRICLVYHYHVNRGRSKWSIDWNNGEQVYSPAYSGSIFIDREVPVVMRVTLIAEGIPASFPIQEAKSTLNYGYQDISGKQFLLPLNSEMRMREGRLLVKNETEFRNYRKYSADAVITFDTEAGQAADPEKKPK
jgi:hypothetical protein